MNGIFDDLWASFAVAIADEEKRLGKEIKEDEQTIETLRNSIDKSQKRMKNLNREINENKMALRKLQEEIRVLIEGLKEGKTCQEN